MRGFTTMLLGALLVQVGPGLALAHPELSSARFVDSLHGSDFIFEGVVRAVDYKSSRPSKTEGAMPHTFVTFEIRKVYKGDPGGLQTVTLRFLGGATPGGRSLQVSGYPLFDVGDRDILMVEGNGESSCPLIGCAQGRFRIIDGMTYTALGNEVDLDADGALAFGPEHRLPDVDSDVIGGHRFEAQILEPDASGNYGPPAQLETPPGWRHMRGEDFDSFLERMIRSTLSRRELKRQRPLVSADIHDDFSFALVPEHAPASRASRSPEPVDPAPATSAEEARELELYLANGGDPRL